jgi:uncharacterized delta-60 repeat protein
MKNSRTIRKLILSLGLQLAISVVSIAQGPPGTLDMSFVTGTGFGASNVYAIVLQPDGKIIAGGDFTSYNGTPCNRIVRLNEDGTVDPSFVSNLGTGFNMQVTALALQSDGKIVVGGFFSTLNGISRNAIARLDGDGSPDMFFEPGTGFSFSPIPYILSIVIQPSDGKIIAAGEFTSYNGTARNRIARLHPSGTLDTDFDPEEGFDAVVNTLALQSDGKIIAGGAFTSYYGYAQNRITRINSSGAIDNFFFSIGSGFDNDVHTLKIQSDGKIIAGGEFTSYRGTNASLITRIKDDGTIDESFLPGTGFEGSFPVVKSIVLQPNGKIITGGYFSTYNGEFRWYITRLNGEDGSLDPFFDAGNIFNSTIYSMVLQPDDKLLVAGSFHAYLNSTDFYRIARVYTMPPDIVITSANPTNICAGELITVAFGCTHFNSDTYFTAVLSDATGDFTNETIIGYVLASASGSANLTIPLNTPAGSGYRVKLVPSVEGGNNGTDINILPAASLSGTITYNGSAVSSGKVYILLEMSMGVAGWHKADSAEIDASGNYTFPILPDYFTSYILGAVPDHTTYPDAIPSFYATPESTFRWDDPNYTLSITNVCGVAQTKNIDVIDSGTLDGSCTFEGYVSWATGKKEAEEPAPLIDVVAYLSPSGIGVAHTTTDETGHYQFTNLPASLDNYKIFVSYPGIPMTDTYSISVFPTDVLFKNLNFLVDTNSNAIYPLLITQIQGSSNSTNELFIMPNPLINQSIIVLPKSFGEAVSYKIWSSSGQLTTEINGSFINSILLQKENLAAGMYLLEVTNKQGDIKRKKILISSYSNN